MRAARSAWAVASAFALLLASARSNAAGAAASASAVSPQTKPKQAPDLPKKAAPAKALGPSAGEGERAIKPPEGSPAPPPATLSSSKGEPAHGAPHKVGRPPKRPHPTLPEGAAPASPDDDGRRQIAGGPTVDDQSGAKNDPELRELSLAERALFPKPLRGARAGFSWGPFDDGLAAVEASGLPPGFAVPHDSASKEPAKEAEWLKSLTMPNLPTRLDARVLKYLKFYRDDARGQNILQIWAKKCGRLAPALKAEFAKAGLPTDLVWLSLIESGHNPTIVSPAGAAGLWQFVPESARMYGLTVDRWVDERLDPERSTEAAVRYLSDLRTRFGNWELAMAAYNMGHGGLLRAVRKFNTNDFWALSRYEAGLPWETTLYVPKILATAIAMTNKKAFGIDDVEQDPPISFDTVSVASNVDFAEVARAADVATDDVRGLNAAYLSGRTPPSPDTTKRWPVRVPAGRGPLAQQRLGDAPRSPDALLEPHIVRFGDTLPAIASDYGTTVRDLSLMNHIGNDDRLRAGNILLVPRSKSAAPSNPPDEEVVVVPGRRFNEANRRRVFYGVLPGDQVAEVAAAFGVTQRELTLWNALDPSASLQQGMTLQLFINPKFDLSRVRYLSEHEARVLLTGSEEFFDYFESQNGRKRIVVVAKKDDTLASIGRRYGMSTGMMERINRVPSTNPIAPGDKIVVYAKEGAPGDSSAAGEDLARELAAIVAPMPDVLPPMPVPAAPPNGLRAVAP